MIWLKIIQSSQVEGVFPFAGKNPEKFHKRYFLLGVNTTDFEKHTIQAHSALCGHLGAVERDVAGGLPELGHHLVVGEAEQHGHCEALGRRGQRGQDLVRVLQTRALHQSALLSLFGAQPVRNFHKIRREGY